MSIQNSDKNGWEDCPAGTLATLVQSQQAAQHRESRKKLAVASGAVVAVVIAVALIMPQLTQQDGFHGGISCIDVRAQLAEYQAGNLSVATASKVEIHLKECPPCRALWKEMQNSSADNPTKSDSLVASFVNAASHSAMNLYAFILRAP